MIDLIAATVVTTGPLFNYASYLPVLYGVLIGWFAHIGRKLSAGEKPTIRETIGYAMQLGAIALFAAWVIMKFNIDGEIEMMTTACIFALSAQEVVQWVKKVGVRRFLDGLVPPKQ